MNDIEKICGDTNEQLPKLELIDDEIDKLADAIENMLDSDVERKLY